jgi:hypothetical protein
MYVHTDILCIYLYKRKTNSYEIYNAIAPLNLMSALFWCLIDKGKFVPVLN